MRQVVLDTETTGLSPKQGHRIIEIGCVEMIKRRLTGRRYQQYVNPEREVERGAYQVHGLSNDFLCDKPTFKEIAEEFLQFIQGAELIIHNAPFDMGFLNSELSLMPRSAGKILEHSAVLDTLVMARKMHPGQKNNLDALCKRYSVDNTSRELHGALLDAKILALVYLAMTGGQKLLFGDITSSDTQATAEEAEILRSAPRKPLAVIMATASEIEAHDKYFKDS